MTTYYDDCGWAPFGWTKNVAKGVGKCDSGTVLLNGKCSVSQYCETGTVFNSESERCEVNPDCGAGTIFVTENGRCEVSQECATGTVFNSVNGRCEVSTDCAAGTVFNPTNGRCEMWGRCEASQQCAAGTTFDLQSGKCEVDQDCATGTAFNSANSRCEIDEQVSRQPRYANLVYATPDNAEISYKIFANNPPGTEDPQGSIRYPYENDPDNVLKFKFWLLGRGDDYHTGYTRTSYPGVLNTLRYATAAVKFACETDVNDCPMLPSGNTEDTCKSHNSSHSYFDTTEQKCYHEVARSPHAIIYTDQTNTLIHTDENNTVIPIDILGNIYNTRGCMGTIDEVKACIEEKDPNINTEGWQVRGVIDSGVNLVVAGLPL